MVNLYLAHYGVKGMKWGIRKDRRNSGFPPDVKTGNLNLFGSNGHNALFVAGLSGSGKSTFAIDLAPKIKAEIIHLDTYFEEKVPGNNSEFNSFLKKNGVLKENMFSNGRLNYSESDKILPLIKAYPKRVIVEGVQLLDQTMSTEIRSFLKNEPVISLQTPKRVSINRAMKREGFDDRRLKSFIKQADYFMKQKNSLEQELHLAIGKQYIDQLIKQEGGAS